MVSQARTENQEKRAMHRSFSRHIAIVAGVTLAAIAVSTTPAQGQESFELAGDAAAIWNLAGSVSITGGGSAVTVAVRRGGSDGARLAMQTGPIDLRGDVGRVSSLRVVYPGDEIRYADAGDTEVQVRDDGTFYRGDGGRKVKIRSSGNGLDAYADMDVRVPAGRTVLVYLAVGAVEVSNVDGNLTVDVGSADIRATSTRGSLALDTGSGDITLDDARGDVVLDTGSGDVDVRGVSEGELLVDTGSGDVSGGRIAVSSLSVDTGSGDVTLDEVRAPEVMVDTGSGEVSLTFDTGPAEVSVDTGSGDVELTLPSSWTGAVEFDTASGDIHTDFRVTVEEMDDDYLRGRIGEGGGSLEVDTGSGDIRLLKS